MPSVAECVVDVKPDTRDFEETLLIVSKHLYALAQELAAKRLNSGD